MSRRRVGQIIATTMFLVFAGLWARKLPALAYLTCPGGYCVSVTPDGVTESTVDAGSWGMQKSFTLNNWGTNTDTYEIDCGGTGTVTCTGLWKTNSEITLGPGESITIKAKFSVGGGNGNATMTATGHASDSGSRLIVVRPVITFTAPTLTSGDTAVVFSKMPLLQATFLPNDGYLDTTTLVVTVGGDTVTTLTRRNRGLVEWELDSTRQLSAGTAKQVSVRVCLTNGECQTVTQKYLLDNSGKPWVSFAGMPLEALGRQAVAPIAPGMRISGADLETGFVTPAYIAMGSARAAGLIYSQRTSHPRALVNVDVELTWPIGSPDTIKAVLVDGSTHIDSLVTTSNCTSAAGRRCRIVLQGDFAGSQFSTPTRKWLKVEVSVKSSGTTKVTTDSVEAVLVDRRGSAYGNGWAVAGLPRIVAAGSDQMIVSDNGQATVYRGNGGRYLSPPGDFSVLIDTASHFELRFRDGSKLVFNADGWLSQTVSANGNSTAVAYSSPGIVTTITDPTNNAITFNYGSGKLTYISDAGGRQSKVTINGSNLLVYDSLSSPSGNSHILTYAYASTGSNSSVRLDTLTNAAGEKTIVGYSSRNRAIQATLPAVLPETGATAQAPVVKYIAQEISALDTLRSSDSVFATATDPLGNWVRSALGRWGAPTRTWDALGVLARASYTPSGLVAWTEGKVADSTRTYSDYDVLGRLVRVFRWRDATHRLRLDSLVYDANQNVTQRIDARGKVSRFGYDSKHNLIWAANPHNDTTRTWYRSDGLPDSTREPGQISSSRYAYDSTWKNLQVAMNAESDTLTLNTFDSFGRVTQAQQRQVIQVSGSYETTQWQRLITGYNVANQVDSTRVEISDVCQPACGPPPWWYWPILATSADSARIQRVRYRYDRLGRAAAHYDVLGDSTAYSYDALGRVRSRRQPSGIIDSSRYDLAGHLRYRWTPRGAQIAHYYDSRGRDTLTAVPGTGDYRRTFAGPNDELTRFWIANFAWDSIGGVDPQLQWVFSQAGVLLSDTSQGRYATRYYADTLGRDTAIIDIVGTTRLGYEVDRGMLATVTTPWSDVLTYSFGTRGELSGPSLSSPAANNLSRAMTYSQSGKLFAIGNLVAGSVGVGAFRSDTLNQMANLTQTWTMTGGETPDSLYKDSFLNDGWGRLKGFSGWRHDTLMVSDTFNFDLVGNIRVNSEFRNYAAHTNRLVVRGTDSSTYDNAGNLASKKAQGTLYEYGYDALDRLISVRSGGTVVARYAYDVFGRRIVRRVYASGVDHAVVQYLRMIYVGDQVMAETDSTGSSVTRSYTWGLSPDDLVAIHDHGTAAHYYTVQDNLHSIRGLLRRDSIFAEATWRYRPYGAKLDSTGQASVPVRYRWIGREYDGETGFYYVRARYFDPSSQRFTQEDPIGLAGGSNLYAYGRGNPTTGRDLSGLQMKYEPAVFVPHCWSEACDNSWNSYGDHNRDGVDDFDAFTERSWARQLWIEDGGDPWLFSKLYDAADRYITDSRTRETVAYMFFWGDIYPASGMKVLMAELAEEANGRVGYIHGQTNAPPGSKMPGIWLSPDDIRIGNRRYLASLLSHEVFHAIMRRAGVAYDESVEDGRGGRANCWAYGATGWNNAQNGDTFLSCY
jgi:RHS repeat-associated protein